MPIPMTGTLVNTLAVAAGSLIGLAARRSLPERIRHAVMVALGLFTVLIGVRMGLEMQRPLAVILGLVCGGVCGELLRIEQALERLGQALKSVTRAADGHNFGQGFMTASVLFLAGPMTVIGCIQDGLVRDPELLLIKSLMDGISSAILASLLGAGVLCSALAVLVVQGLLTLLAGRLEFLSAPYYLNDFTGVGGIMVLGIGIRLLGIKDIKVGNYLPALVFVVLFLLLGKVL